MANELISDEEFCAGFRCADCDLTWPHDHYVGVAPNGDEVAVTSYRSKDPNAEVRDPDTGEVIFPATKAPFRLIEGGRPPAENNASSPSGEDASASALPPDEQSGDPS